MASPCGPRCPPPVTFSTSELCPRNGCSVRSRTSGRRDSTRRALSRRPLPHDAAQGSLGPFQGGLLSRRPLRDVARGRGPRNRRAGAGRPVPPASAVPAKRLRVLSRGRSPLEIAFNLRVSFLLRTHGSLNLSRRKSDDLPLPSDPAPRRPWLWAARPPSVPSPRRGSACHARRGELLRVDPGQRR